MTKKPPWYGNKYLTPERVKIKTCKHCPRRTGPMNKSGICYKCKKKGKY